MNDVPSSRSTQLYWTCQGIGWGLYTVTRIIAAATALKLSWTTATVELVILDGLGFACTHALRHYAKKHLWGELRIPQLSLRIATGSFILAVPMGLLTQLSHISAMQDPNYPNVGAATAIWIQLVFQILNWAVLFMMWLAVYFSAVGLREYRTERLKRSELARALQLAELRLLKSQLNPHFLFNALNTVRSLIAENPARAQDAVTRLANTLRYTLRSRQDELVTLTQELAIVEDYLELESMRFEDRLQVETAVPADAGGVPVPVMVLQTLVENAIKHGIAELPEGGLLSIRAVLEQEVLIVEVENPRPAVMSPATHEGVGLRNARDRLRLLFGEQASLELDLSRSTVASVRLRVPRRA